MFAPGQEQISKEQITAAEVEAVQTINAAVVGGVLLYLSPFAIDFFKKMF